MASDALTARATALVMSVRLEGRRVRTVGGARAVAVETELVGRLAQLRIIVCTVNVVAGSAGHAVAVHHTLDEIVALHPVLVRGAIRKVQEVGLSKGDVF